MPTDWLEVLRRAVAENSQNAVAKKLHVSATMISQVLAGKYPSSPIKLEVAVRSELMEGKVECPQLGEISLLRCHEEQRRPFAVTNHFRVQLFRACHGSCPNRTIANEPDPAT